MNKLTDFAIGVIGTIGGIALYKEHKNPLWIVYVCVCIIVTIWRFFKK